MKFRLVVLAVGAFAALLLWPPGGAADDTGAALAQGRAYKLIGWNDLGMHCFDGKDYSIFAVLPPYNTIHAHLIDNRGKVVQSNTGYTVTYQAELDQLTNTTNSTSAPKTNFWQYAARLFFGNLQPDQGLKGYNMPGSGNTPQAMGYSNTDHTFLAVGIPLTNYADSSNQSYPVNYFPMMRLTAKNSSGTVLATTDIVLPISDELSCGVCHASGTGTPDAKPKNGWVYNPDPSKDMKLNILRKHDDLNAGTQLFQNAAAAVGYNPVGLEQTVTQTPVLCAACHADNALGAAGYPGIETETNAIHANHASAIDPATNQPLDNGTTRDACYRCHPGPKTQCLRGVMGNLTDNNGNHIIECQSCHGNLTRVGDSTRNGWLDEPNCQACHTGTATHNNGQIVYTSVWDGNNMRVAVDQTFATNPNTPQPGTSLYRFSAGHHGVQCEACHNSTHAEVVTSVLNDNVQNTNLQGHSGTLVECLSCHPSQPITATGGPHGIHPVGQVWVSNHPNVSQNPQPCQLCHGTDYKGTILSRAQVDRTFTTDGGVKRFSAGTIIGCYSCHNGPHGG
jgi:hypothetical protein